MSRWAWLFSGLRLVLALAIGLPVFSCALLIAIKPMEVRQLDPDMVLATRGQEAIILRQTYEWPVIGMAGDILGFDNIVLRDRRGREHRLARYVTDETVEPRASGPGCAQLGKPPAPAVRIGGVTVEWPTADTIRVHIGFMRSVFTERVEQLASLHISYEVGCVNHP